MRRDEFTTPPPQEKTSDAITSQFSTPASKLAMKINNKSVTVTNLVFDKPIGRGSFGVVYNAVLCYIQDGIEYSLPCVAKKIVRDTNSAANEFQLHLELTEDQLASAESGIISLVCTVDIRGECYAIMPKGEFTLRESIPAIQQLQNKNEPLYQSLIVDVFYSMLNTLTTLNKNKYVHADIKPENIVWRNSDNSDFSGWCAIDFGLSKPVDTTTKHISGTPIYVAPEVCAKGYYSQSADIYAYALIFEELRSAMHTASPLITKEELWNQKKLQHRLFRTAERELITSIKPGDNFYSYLDKVISAMKHSNEKNRPTLAELETALANLKHLTKACAIGIKEDAHEFYNKFIIEKNAPKKPIEYKIKRVSTRSLESSASEDSNSRAFPEIPSYPCNIM